MKANYVACVVDGRSVSEVARMFGIPPNTVSQIKRRGIKRMQGIMDYAKRLILE